MEIFYVTPRDRKHFTARDYASMNGLLKQLSSNPYPEVTYESLRRTESSCLLFVVRDDNNAVAAMASIAIVHTLKGRHGRVEDVVVDQKHRGKGVGKMLMRMLIATAKQRRLSHLDLTSAPVRVEANELYKKLGFVLRETNVYRLKFDL